MITGYRRYKLNGATLVGAQTEWHSREMQAQCTRPIYEFNLSEMDTILLSKPKDVCAYHLSEKFPGRCMCGIYVVKEPDLVDDYRNWPAIVAVSAWGNYIEFEYGYRIQFARMEHIWIEPAWIEHPQHGSELDSVTFCFELQQRYGVPVEIRKSAVCCGQDHEMAFWPSARGPISLCRMETGHIVNCLRYMKRVRSGAEAKWKWIFEKELERRAPKIVDGKMKVTF